MKDLVEDLAKRSADAVEKALTEEATKTSVILSFIKALGFDPFDLDEVVPEFVADVGTKKGEKVDYALKIDGKATILVEAKPISMSLGQSQYSQLYRYFGVTDAKLAILTNGKEAWFFSDIDEPNRLDRRPFFKFNFLDHDENQIEQLNQFTKQNFSIEQLIQSASNLRLTSLASAYFKRQFENPDEDFVRFIGKNVYDGTLTKSVVEQLRPVITSSFDQIIRDYIQEKLGVTFQHENAKASQDIKAPQEETPDDNDGIFTTEEELQAFYIVRAIASKSIELDRVTIRDARSYCSVFVDNNNRKPICRFYFNAKTKKTIGIFDPEKNEEKFELSALRDIYTFSESIQKTVESYK